jgi:hypothetical protein
LVVVVAEEMPPIDAVLHHPLARVDDWFFMLGYLFFLGAAFKNLL